MFVKGLRKFLYAGALLALAPIMARAEDKAPETIGAPKTAAVTSAPAPCAPTTCKVKELVCVQEPYEYTRTTYKPVTKEETYTAYKCETVSEQKTSTYTVYKKVCETVMETRTVVKKVPCIEERVENVTKWKLEQVTEMKQKTVHSGHFECCTVPASPGFFSSLGHKSCDPCAPVCCATKTVRKWVSECHTECVPVCRTKLVKECVPVCKKVCTYKCVTETCQVPVTKVKCIPETKTCTYTVCKQVQVPYTAKRCVTVCEPVVEKCTGTRTVAKWVEKEVPVTTTCCDPCATASKHFFASFRGRLGGCGCGCK